MTRRFDTDFARRAMSKGTGVDPNGFGSYPGKPGTSNFKRKYEPDFPVVTIVATAPCRIVSREALDTAGLLAPPEPVKVLSKPRGESSRAGKWPSYTYCLERAPLAHGQNQPKREPG